MHLYRPPQTLNPKPCPSSIAPLPVPASGGLPLTHTCTNRRTGTRTWRYHTAPATGPRGCGHCKSMIYLSYFFIYLLVSNGSGQCKSITYSFNNESRLCTLYGCVRADLTCFVRVHRIVSNKLSRSHSPSPRTRYHLREAYLHTYKQSSADYAWRCHGR